MYGVMMDLPPFDKYGVMRIKPGIYRLNTPLVLGRGDTIIGIGATVVNMPEPLTPDEQQAMQNELNGRCKDCRWWGLNATSEADVCDIQPECLLAKSHTNKPDTLSSLAWAVDHEEYEAELVTKPDFGCVSWRARETT